MFDADFVMEPKKDYLEISEVEVEDPSSPEGVAVQEVYVDSRGEQVDPGAIQFDKDQRAYVELPETESKVKKERAFLKPVCYKDFIWDWEAKEFSEWEYCGFRSKLTRRQISSRFGKDALGKLKPINTDSDKPRTLRDKEEMIELWYKPTRTRYIFAIGGSEFIQVSKDPYEIEQFFPIAYPMFDNITSEHSMPFTEYLQVRDLLENIHDLFDRISQAVRLARPRALFDSSVPQLSKVITKSRQGDYVGVPNLGTKARSGQVLVQYLDTGPIIVALQQFMAEFDKEMQAYDQITQFSDIMRGQTNPYETKAAQERKVQYSSNRIKPLQQDMQRWCRDNYRLLLDIALGKFSDERIFEILEPSLEPEERENFGQIIKKLKSDNWRSFSLDIETDSTILIDEDAHKAQAIELAQAIGGYLGQVGQTAQQSPEVLPVMTKVLDFVIQRFRGSKEFQDDIRGAMEQVMAAAQQRMQQAQQQQDPKMMEMQFKQQQAVAEHQMQSQELAHKVQLDNRKQMFAEYAEQYDQKINEAKLQLESQAQQLKAIIESRGMGLKEKEQALSQYIETNRLEMDKALDGLKVQELFMEEARLREKQNQPQLPSQPQSPGVVVVQSPQPAPQPVVVNPLPTDIIL